MNNYDKALSLCLPDPKIEIRKWMHSPFIIGDKAYSTNAYLMCVAPVSKLGQEYGTLEQYDPERIVRNIPEPKEAILTATREDMRFILDHCPKVNEMEVIQNEIKCRSCDGVGEVEWEYYFDKETHYDYFECPVCSGDGLMQKEIKKESGNKILDPEALVKCGMSVFRMAAFKTVIDICEVMESDAELVHQDKPLGASLFRVGDLLLLVMPVMQDSIDDKTFFNLKSKTNEQ